VQVPAAPEARKPLRIRRQCRSAGFRKVFRHEQPLQSQEYTGFMQSGAVFVYFYPKSFAMPQIIGNFAPDLQISSLN
jgi:hypothetical protein